MKIGDKHYYYIHRGLRCYEVVFCDKEITTNLNTSVEVFTTRGSTIKTPSFDIYHSIKDIEESYQGAKLICNCDYPTISDYISHLRMNKLINIFLRMNKLINIL